MDKLIDKIYEFPATPVTDFQDIWKPYNKMCDEMEEEDFLVKNINLFKVQLAIRKMTKENTLNDGHKVKVADLIKEKEKENDRVKIDFDNTIEEIQRDGARAKECFWTKSYNYGSDTRGRSAIKNDYTKNFHR